MKWALLALGALAVVAAGVFTGIAVAGGFTSDANADALVPASRAPVYDCPAGTPVTDYSPGSRVFVVAETESGDWIQIRDLDQPGRRLWVRSADVVLDSITLNLPVSDCDTSEVAVGAVDTTTSTTLTEATTTTTVAASTTTTATPTTTAPPPPPPTTEPPPVTTTTPTDTASPEIRQPSAVPASIWELDGGGLTCPGKARQSAISAIVTDNVAVTAVTASWSIGGAPTVRSMAKNGDSYSTTFGPFPYQTVTEFAPFTENVTITIRAVDGSGNESSSSTSVTVHSLQECQP